MQARSAIDPAAVNVMFPENSADGSFEKCLPRGQRLCVCARPGSQAARCLGGQDLLVLTG
jgi:hypothetical protein